MPVKSPASALTTIIQRLNQKHPDARYELNWETPLQLLVGTILAAQSTDERINQVTPGLFKKYPDAKAFADADFDELAQDLKPTGFYRNKAKAVQGACKALVEQFNGEVPRTMEELTTLPGVARKTANVVLNNAFRIPSGVIVDTHVVRVSQRLGLTKQTRPEKIEQDLMNSVPKDEWVQFGPALVLHGRYTCTHHTPQCDQCIFSDLCPRIGVKDSAEEEEEAPPPKKGKAKAVPAVPPNAAGFQFSIGSSSASEVVAPPLVEQLPADWREVLAAELKKPYFKKLEAFVAEERAEHTVFPPPEDVFNAFRVTPYEQVKVLLLGQDPYHDDGQAHGMCFSVRPGVKPPPSLVNIFKELHDDIGCPEPKEGHLVSWANQGVMLLNAVLTVRAHKPASHKEQGWETFTDAVIRALNERKTPVVFLLWGAYAQKKQELIDGKNHVVLTAAHPSPLSVKKFFGSKPFSQANAALERLGQKPIHWHLTAPAPAETRQVAEVPPQAVEKPPVPTPPAVTNPIPQVLDMMLDHAESLRHASQLPASWLTALADQFSKPYYQKLEKFVASERKVAAIAPAEDAVFQAFKLAAFDRVKVVLLGDEPPARAEHADGLAFSVRPGAKPTPALGAIFRELRDDVGCWLPQTGHLAPWGLQGVLLLNRELTVRAKEPGSHAGKGWESFTDAALRALNYRPRPVIFVLWGDEAQTKRRLIDGRQHVVLTLPHPTEAAFAGSRPFSAINNALELRCEAAIYWQLFGA
jgi:uracil-DNA glycosylase